ncbi:phycobilisome linker polypeptide [Leptolyngbya sp. BL0902]|uniref:phycobilisome rod-core linker polypeptide n=1 Tax=Leptolyngbya sp. BL0902 TaxID=1115757 RepID=UPI0018E88F51|nr:phycobilisome rod-core linker polypeptide [Leptolyngbya sp. BL0902]QQE63851.1 phycobilisome linker polypeptide [Leptolyngbya sp. BL0902]
MTVINELTPKEITVSRQSDREERQTALRQIYAQVLERQPYAYERKVLAKDEEDFLRNKIGVKRFLRILGQSEVYLNEFYYGSSNLKFIELCFKHFIGRAPKDGDEMREYCDVLMRHGVKELITALLDSDEYDHHFGCFTVPHAWTDEQYPSPRTYWETDVLLHELHGRRGWVLPTMTWHDLHLNCDGGSCALDTAPASVSQPMSVPTSPTPSTAAMGALHQVLSTMSPADIAAFAQTLSPGEREKLRAMLMQPVGAS